MYPAAESEAKTVPFVKADSHAAVYRYEYGVRAMVLPSLKHNIYSYYFDFKACAV